ncbi:3'(2'),5'-bisphosphate nucleotidase CysQ [Janthinobacterium sp. GB4P2]|uniref:3'(2'),5'-bisphosphate nucleotidase CysQ n=1 Tax=Janthinobacterium sp. GB4P2 TaxID=3424189 RepID=UPI003F2888D4
MSESALLQSIVELSERAGAAIMKVYQGDFEVDQKLDASPLTAADVAAHNIIAMGLSALSPLPQLSEEGADIDWELRRTWTRYWLIDPLDGTREFVSRNGEFTVNIALIEHGRPILGVVHAPALQRTYFASQGLGAFRQDGSTLPRAIRVSAAETGEAVRVVGSRSHTSHKEHLLHQFLGNVSVTAMGSSLKFCLVAEGAADVYPRFGPTSEWDTAAAQCIVEEAGGTMLCDQLAPLAYNAKASLLNPAFIACGAFLEHWRPFFQSAAHPHKT